MLEICSGRGAHRHDEITFEGHLICPLCEALKMIRALEIEIEELKNKEGG